MELTPPFAKKILAGAVSAQPGAPAANPQRRGWHPIGEAAYLRTLALSPRDADTLRKLAWLYVQTGKNVEVALLLAKEAASLRPEDARILYTLGRASYATRDFDLARESFEAALKLRPSEPGILYQLGATEYELGHLAEARGALEKALAIDPEFRDAEPARTLLTEIEARAQP